MRLRGARGVSLLELLIVVAILGVAAAMAVPNLFPTVQRHRLHAQTLAVSGFVDQARRRAMAEGRCVRVRKVGANLVAEKRDSSDCVNLASTNTLDTWTQINVLSTETGTSYTLEGKSFPTGVTAADHTIIFRPSGRLYGDGDVDVSDDGARIMVLNPSAANGQIDQSQDQRAVVIEPIGRICSVFYGPRQGDAGAVTDADKMVCP